MHSLRRAVLRQASVAARAASTKPQAATPIAARFAPASGVQQASPAAVAARFFSQTSRVAQEDVLEPGVGTTQETATGREETQTKKVDVNAPETDYAVFVRNLVFDANESHLEDAFSKYGKVAKTAVARDARGLSRGYGFVWFTDAEASEKAITEGDGSFWHGRRIQVSPRAAKAARAGAPAGEPSSSIYIGNIPYETTDAELNALFAELPNVTDVRVAVDRTTGWPRGFAHADFTDAESAKNAIEKLGSLTLAGRQLRLDYSSPSKNRGQANRRVPDADARR